MAVPLHCLQVEDSESDAALVFRLLKKAEFEVHGERVESAEDLRLALSRKQWDVIIADYHLPGFDAYKALSILQETGLDIPFIGISGKVGNEIAAEIMRRGAADYLTKDELVRLVPVIKRELREAEIRRCHRKAEASLQNERERFDSALRCLEEAVITTDANGSVITMNPIAEQITCQAAAKASGKSLSELIHLRHAETNNPLPNPASLLLRGEIEQVSGEAYLIDRQGCEHKIAYGALPVRSERNEIHGTVMVFREIADEERQANNLLSSNRLRSIGVIASEIAHDFSNILSIIMGNIELAQEYCRRKNLAKAMERLDSALKVFNNAKNTAFQLISISQGGKPLLRSMPVGPVICCEARKFLRRADLHHETELPEDLWKCRIDETQISLALDNIFANSRHIITAGGSMHIKAENLKTDAADMPPQIAGDAVRISIIVACPGIEPHRLPRLINADDPACKLSENGLEICSAAAIIKQHGGLLRVEPQAAGIAYFIYIPAVREI
ncbi:MAG: hypothetical protein GQF41_3379 [Candidatus Rifleibacterium amylolyticum]|nr:MAG: hypothetical protein GQF41_3379 [Candidatus Rifleibacterium amylolyticum]